VVKIRNVPASWRKEIGKAVQLWVDNSCWDGSGEYIYTFVIGVTPKGVRFGNNPGSEFTYFWKPFNKIEGYKDSENKNNF
jgi:hypothetical protein